MCESGLGDYKEAVEQTVEQQTEDLILRLQSSRAVKMISKAKPAILKSEIWLLRPWILKLKIRRSA